MASHSSVGKINQLRKMSGSGIIIRGIFVALLLGQLPQAASSQELTPVMEEFKTLCVQTRDAIGKRDREALDECRAGVYNFYLKDIGQLNLIPVDTLQKEMPDSLLCAVFDLKYIDNLRDNDIDLSRVRYVGHSSNRDPNDQQHIPKSGCYICHKGIPAQSTVSYKIFGCRNNMRLVVVVAEKDDVNLTVTSLTAESGDAPVEQSVTPSDMGLLVHTWKMPASQSEVELKFENPNKTSVTCVIALQ